MIGALILSILINTIITIRLINVTSKKVINVVYDQLDKDTKEIFKFIEDKLS